MGTIDAASDAMKDTETRLRALLAEAAGAGDYDSAEVLTGVARALRDLINSLPRGATPLPNTAKTSSPNGDAAARTSTPSTLNQKRGGAAAYPHFVGDGENLIKIGWSNRAKAEYEHKAPQAVLTVLARTLQRLGTNGKRVEMADVLPLKHPANGSEIPDYQAYLCLAWLRSLKLLRRHGRQGYSVPRGTDIPTVLTKHWNELRRR